MDFSRSLPAEGTVRTLMVIEAEVFRQALIEFRDALVVPQVDVLVLHRAPESLDEVKWTPDPGQVDKLRVEGTMSADRSP